MTPTCTGCPALIRPVPASGYCCMGYKTGTVKQDGRRIRVPVDHCERPRSLGDVALRAVK